MFWPQTQTGEGIWTIPRCTHGPCVSLSSNDYPNICHRKRGSNKAIGIPAEKDKRAMSFLEKKVEDLKITVPDTVRGNLDFTSLQQR